MAISEGEVVAWAEDGRFLITGDEGAVDRFVAELEPRRRMSVTDFRPAADAVAVLSAVIGAKQAAAALVQVDPVKWAQLLQRGVPDGTGAFLPTVRDAKGLFMHNMRLRPISGLQAANMQGTLVMLALRLAIEEVKRAVERIAADVDDLKRTAEASAIGDLAGLYRVLANARKQADDTGSIPQAGWDAVAPHEVTAQQAADRLRVLLHRRIQDLPLDGDAGERLEQAQRLVDDEFFARNLRLLVLAEQCRLLWRSLKLDQIRRTEPDALVGEAMAAKTLLEENAAADQRLINDLEHALSRLGKLGPLDGSRFLTRDELPASVKALRAQVEDFAATRQQQIDSWVPDPSPTLGDALSELGLRAEAVAIDVRRTVGSWLVDLGSALSKEPEPTVKETVDAGDVPKALDAPERRTVTMRVREEADQPG
ncbi:hypothetical protein [Actinomycetospora aeridis]|uniref:Uncharacterized protein n=1 Tax=Actinomycetospora aeridis TaxID=3129231 RepID=A0ABU8N8Z6_9PSEU